MYDVKAFVAREALQHLGVQGVHVGRSDGPFPGLAKEGAKLWVVRLSHLLIEGDNVGEAVPDQLSKGGSFGWALMGANWWKSPIKTTMGRAPRMTVEFCPTV